MISNPAIVVCGHDPLLLMTRESILLRGGYKVRPRQTVSSAIQEMQNGTPTLVVVCHTFSPSEVEQLLIAAYAVGCEKVMLLSRKMHGVEVMGPGLWRVGSMNPRMFLQAVGEELADEQRGSSPDAMTEIFTQQ